jgi:SAM-dependent methyltransferase
LIENLLEKGKPIKVLEVGCSSGAFLSELNDGLKAKGLSDRVDLSGIDIDAAAIKRSVDEEISLYTDSAESFSDKNENTFDLVLHFELLEHLRDPIKFMKAVYAMLNEGGYCHFHTPNANGFDNQALGYNDFRPLAHGIFPPMHLQAFTPHNILHFILRAEFKLHQLDTPGNFDVDIVKRFSDREPKTEFSFINQFSDDQLAIVQLWLKKLFASSHMRCTVYK